VPQILPEEWERTPQRAACFPLQPPLWWVHLPPKLSSSISCRVHKLVVNPVRLPNLMYYSGRISTYRLDRTTVTVGAPRMLAISTNPASAGTSSWASVAVSSSATAAAGAVPSQQQGADATTTPRVHLWWGPGSGWLQRLSHCVPIAFVTLLYGVGRRHLLQAREFRCQCTTSRLKCSTTLFKTVYLLGRGLHDLKLLGHALAGHVARPPWRRGQTSLQASRWILNERNMRQSRAAES
jgi:hypothetical protein